MCNAAASLRNEGGIRDLCQLHEPHAVAVLVGHTSGKLDCQPGLSRAADARQSEQSGSANASGNTGELVIAAHEAGQCNRQVVAAFCAGRVTMRRSSPSHGLNRGSESLRIIRCELERLRQTRRGVAIRVCGAAFELLNSVDAQARALGELLLRQPSCEAVPP
jgi:hypothetical protein